MFMIVGEGWGEKEREKERERERKEREREGGEREWERGGERKVFFCLRKSISGCNEWHSQKDSRACKK